MQTLVENRSQLGSRPAMCSHRIRLSPAAMRAQPVESLEGMDRNDDSRSVGANEDNVECRS